PSAVSSSYWHACRCRFPGTHRILSRERRAPGNRRTLTPRRQPRTPTGGAWLAAVRALRPRAAEPKLYGRRDREREGS
ncbi:MAG: hypothetical protein ABSA02_37435, partial [Trebonia sp.]